MSVGMCCVGVKKRKLISSSATEEMTHTKQPEVRVWHDSDTGVIHINVLTNNLTHNPRFPEPATVLTLSPSKCTIRTLHTDHKFRNRGYATLAMNIALKQYLKDCPCVAMLAYPDRGFDKEILHKFFKKFGFDHCAKEGMFERFLTAVGLEEPSNFLCRMKK
jgi:GNAT superfamily N-acetyltransferase